MTLTRRGFVASSAAGAAAMLHGTRALAASATVKGGAEHCILIWLGGGMAHIDTFDPKRRGDGKQTPGSYYDSIPTAVPDVRVCQHLRRCAPMMDRMTVIRSVHHEVIDEHAAAVVQVHTGRPTSGTIQYPSLGSIIAHQLGAANPIVPAYTVIGYPNTARNPGFLGPEYGYLHVTDTASGPPALARARDISTERQRRRESLLNRLRQNGVSDNSLAQYGKVLDESLRLASPEFMRVFDLREESASLRERYGGEFGQRCLLGRRLVEAGVRFVEISHNLNFVNGTGWDTHNQGQRNQHLLIKELDQALAELIRDLEGRGTLDKTLVVVATEFGRPAAFDAGGGRGHYSKAYSMVLAGGGLQHRGAYGETDELGMKIAADPVTVPDFLATILATLGIDPARELYAGNRPVPITDGGRPLEKLL
jgi:hypothetical protein